jgi:inosine-uridine nucleoside N-ribohydrolase
MVCDEASLNLAFTHESEKGQFIFDIYQHCYGLWKGYAIADQIAMALAFYPEVATSYIDKHCTVECEGKFTKGMLVINWLNKDH